MSGDVRRHRRGDGVSSHLCSYCCEVWPCQTVERITYGHPVSGDVRRQIAEALKGHEPIYRDGYLTGEPGHFVCECGRWISDPEHSDVDDPGADHRRHQADALLPVVDRIARARAAEELRAAADEDAVTLETWFGTSATHVTAVKTGELLARADALTAEPQP